MAVNRQQRPAVVVVGLDCVTGLQVARVFARRGVRVIGVASDRRHFCCRTNACDLVSVSETDSPALIDTLNRIGETFEDKAVLVPCTDNSVLQISRGRERLQSKYYIGLADHDLIETLADKVRFPEFARENGFSIPVSVELSSVDDIREMPPVRYPAVLKPAFKTPLWLKNTKQKAILVSSQAQLEEVFPQYSQWSEKLVLQEWIPGPIENHFTVEAYFGDNAEPLVTFVSQKLRQWPAETGIGTLSQVCDNPAVRHEAIRLFQAAGYKGLAYVEMKRDEASGEYAVIEANIGRPTGRSCCAEAAGVDLLYSMYCDRVGLPLPQNRVQENFGLKWVYWKRDLRAAWSALWAGKITLGHWWKSVKGPKACAVFSLRDPLPFFADWLREIRRLWM